MGEVEIKAQGKVETTFGGRASQELGIAFTGEEEDIMSSDAGCHGVINRETCHGQSLTQEEGHFNLNYALNFKMMSWKSGFAWGTTPCCNILFQGVKKEVVRGADGGPGLFGPEIVPVCIVHANIN